MKMLACCRVAVVSRTCVSEGGKTEAFSLAFVPPIPLFLARSDANCIHGVILSTSFSFSLKRAVCARECLIFLLATFTLPFVLFVWNCGVTCSSPEGFIATPRVDCGSVLSYPSDVHSLNLWSNIFDPPPPQSDRRCVPYF